MSLPGVIQFRGKLCDVFRPVKAEGAGGLTTVTWPTVPLLKDARILLDVISGELAQKIFGREVTVDLRGTMLKSPAILEEDGIVVKAGPYQGQRFRVTGRMPHDVRPAAAHQELALERTTEVFG